MFVILKNVWKIFWFAKMFAGCLDDILILKIFAGCLNDIMVCQMFIECFESVWIMP